MIPANSPSEKRTRTRWGVKTVLVVPPIVLLGLLLIWGANEYRESRVVHSRIQAYQDVNLRAHDKEAAQSIADPTRSAGTLQWLKLLRQAERLRYRNFGEYLMLGPKGPTDILTKFFLSIGNDDFEQSDGLYEDFLMHMQPVVEQLDELSMLPQSIWTPRVNDIRVGGWYAADHLSQLLYLDLFLAIRQQDRPRILASLKRLIDLERLLAEVIPTSSFHRAINRLESRYLCLSFCLLVPDWTADELTQLERFMKPTQDYTKLWQDDIDSWSAEVMKIDAQLYADYRQSNIREILHFPTSSWQAETLRWYDQLSKLKMDDLPQAALELKHLLPANQDGLSLDTAFASQQVLSEMESLRKLVLCGLALRRYKLAYGRWPTDLRHAVSNGPGNNLMVLADGQEIGYAVGYYRGVEIWLPRVIMEDASHGKRQESKSLELKKSFRTLIRDTDSPPSSR
jgi:hypothetical protein